MKRTLLALAIASLTLVAFTGSAAPPTPPTLDVNVVNTPTKPALVRDVDSQSRGARFVETLQVLFTTGAYSMTKSVVPTVPYGKKLFLQSVNTHTLLTDGQSMMDLRLSIVNPSEVARFSIDQDPQAVGSGQGRFTGHLTINMMLEPEESIELLFFRNGATGSSSMNFSTVTLVGYFVDAN